jgi:hypothetical protein
MTTRIRTKAWSRFALLIGGTIAMTQTSMDARPEPAPGTKPAAQAKKAGGGEAIRPFRVHFSDAELADLKRRVNATKWPDREQVTDDSQGVQLDTIQKLARYWATEYDWRKVEAQLNALPNFITNIDGLDIHFIHVRSKHEDALPMIVTHGWPGSVIEQMKIIDPLTNPTAHDGKAEDAFDVVIPSIKSNDHQLRIDRLGYASGLYS